MANVTPITPPRVPLLDVNSGVISREWYQFFLSLYRLSGGGSDVMSLQDVQLGPQPADYSNEIAALSGSELEPPAEPVVLPGDPLEPKAQPALLSQLHDVGAFNPTDGDKLIFNGTASRWEKDSRSYLILDE
jgi:hypothetical protein